nr:hypothetical protein [uncultured Desulfuromonas sp.]
MRRTVLILMALSLTLMASTSFAKQSRDDDSHKRSHVVQQDRSYDSHYGTYDRGNEKHRQYPGKHAVKISRHDNRKHHYNVAEYHHRQPNCNSYKPNHRDQRTTIVLPAPPIPRVVVYFPW